MSRNTDDHEFGIEPYANERDDELAMDAYDDHRLQDSAEPILQDDGDDEMDETPEGVWANSVEDLY